MQPTSSEDVDALRRHWSNAEPLIGHPRVREFAVGGHSYIGLEARPGGRLLFASERRVVSRLSREVPTVALQPVLDQPDLLVFPKMRPMSVPRGGLAADRSYGQQMGELLARVHGHAAPRNPMREERITTMPLTIDEWSRSPERVVQLAASFSPFREEIASLERVRAAARERRAAVTLHGDFKPDNVVIDDRDRPMAIDWEMSGSGPAVEDFAALWAGLFVELVVQELSHAVDADFRQLAGRIEGRIGVIVDHCVRRYASRTGATPDPGEVHALSLLRLLARLESLYRSRSAPSVEEVFLTRALAHGLRTLSQDSLAVVP